MLAERDSETKDLRLQVSELEAGISDLTSKFETTLAHLEEQSNAKDNELENMNTKLRQMEDQLDMLEDENDKLKVGGDQTKEEDGAEKEKLEGMLAILREVRYRWRILKSFHSPNLLGSIRNTPLPNRSSSKSPNCMMNAPPKSINTARERKNSPVESKTFSTPLKKNVPSAPSSKTLPKQTSKPMRPLSAANSGSRRTRNVHYKSP